MFLYFKKTLEKYNRNFILLKGGRKERLAIATKHIDNLLNKGNATNR